MSIFFLFYYILVNLFIWLCWVLVYYAGSFQCGADSLIVAHRLSSYSIMTLSCNQAHRIFVPPPWIEPRLS